MPTFGNKSQATHKSSSGSIVIEGDDLLAKTFLHQALTIRPSSAAVTVAFAKKAAARMRSRVPVDEGDLLDSITSDDDATVTPLGAYADAGPDRTANPGAFKGHLIERGTVKMGPQPFVGPTGDETLPEFVKAIKALAL